jgi:GNAT superfamily N-acetyltransferase
MTEVNLWAVVRLKSATNNRLKLNVCLFNESRKKGYAAAILNALETCATNEGFIDTIFEIGKAQIEALSFYPKQGYTVIPNFSPYMGVENSVCF